MQDTAENNAQIHRVLSGLGDEQQEIFMAAQECADILRPHFLTPPPENASLTTLQWYAQHPVPQPLTAHDRNRTSYVATRLETMDTDEYSAADVERGKEVAAALRDAVTILQGRTPPMCPPNDPPYSPPVDDGRDGQRNYSQPGGGR